MLLFIHKNDFTHEFMHTVLYKHAYAVNSDINEHATGWNKHILRHLRHLHINITENIDDEHNTNQTDVHRNIFTAVRDDCN